MKKSNKVKLSGKAYILANHGKPPRLFSGRDKEEWYIIRTSLNLLGKSEILRPLHDENLDKEFPSFTIVATDKESVKKLFCEEVDHMFQNYEENEQQSSPDFSAYKMKKYLNGVTVNN